MIHLKKSGQAAHINFSLRVHTNQAQPYPFQVIARTAEGKFMLPYSPTVRVRHPRTQFVTLQ